MSIEKRLEEIRAEALTYERGNRELTAVRCYLKNAVFRCEAAWADWTHGITNQLALLREIDRTNANREPVCLVTFNYDRLLETALESLGSAYKFEKMQDYTAKDHLFQLFKLHGSIDWGLEYDNSPTFALHPANKVEAARIVIDQVWKVRDPEDYVFSSPLTLLSKDNRPVCPAIAIPVEDKNDFQCPKPTLDTLMQLMPDVTKVITIGWRASEAHFLRLMNTHLKPGVPIFVVAGKLQEAEAVQTGIIGAMPGAHPSCRAEKVAGFTHFMQSGLATKILSA